MSAKRVVAYAKTQLNPPEVLDKECCWRVCCGVRYRWDDSKGKGKTIHFQNCSLLSSHVSLSSYSDSNKTQSDTVGILQVSLMQERKWAPWPVDAWYSKKPLGTSLVVQWVRLHTHKARGPGSTPGQGTKSLMHAATKFPCATTKTKRSQK